MVEGIDITWDRHGPDNPPFQLGFSKPMERGVGSSEPHSLIFASIWVFLSPGTASTVGPYEPPGDFLLLWLD